MFRIAFELDSEIAQAAQVLERGEGSFARQPIQAPKQQAVKAVGLGFLPHGPKARPVPILRAQFVCVLGDHVPTLLLGELPELQKLVERILTSVVWKLHAKAAVVDTQALLSSANLTDDAFLRNLELGALFMGGDMPAKLREHFENLIVAGTLLRWSP